MADKITKLGSLQSIKKGYFIAYVLLINAYASVNLVDLETKCSDFVLETKQIIIPGHEYAFNASILNWNGSLLLSFRELPDQNDFDTCNICSSGLSKVGLIFLNQDLSLASPPYILNLPGVTLNEKIVARSEDARLITVGNDLFIVYSDNTSEVITEGGFRMHIGKLEFDGNQFILKNIESLTNFPGNSSRRREKNWVPFEYHGKLHLAYSILPHKIFEPALDGSGFCNQIATTSFKSLWKWGELRGGTPALLCGDEYLSFFHSSIKIATRHSGGKKIPHYFIGAYTFKRDDLFEITKISKEPIIGENFYHGKNYEPYWHPVQVVFPCGYYMDGDYIWLSYGRQDHEIWIAKIDKTHLLNSLTEVTPKEL